MNGFDVVGHDFLAFHIASFFHTHAKELQYPEILAANVGLFEISLDQVLALFNHPCAFSGRVVFSLDGV